MQKFNFLFETITKNKQVMDQNTFAFKIINLGGTNCTINNSYPLIMAAPIFGVYEEKINTEEKTIAQYSIVFQNETDPANKVLIISKVWVK